MEREIGCTFTPMALPRPWTQTAKRLVKLDFLATIGEGRSELLDDGVAGLAESIVHWRGLEKSQDDISILAFEFSGPAQVIRHRGPISAATCDDELRT